VETEKVPWKWKEMVRKEKPQARARESERRRSRAEEEEEEGERPVSGGSISDIWTVPLWPVGMCRWRASLLSAGGGVAERAGRRRAGNGQ
jgi:hypothetical protein